MNNQRQYEKVSAGSNNRKWAPQKETDVVYSDKNPAVLEGYYIRITEIANGPNKPFNVYEIQTLEKNNSLGEAFDVAIGIGFENTMANIKIGAFIRIEYKGKKPSKIAGRQPFNDTDVFQDPNAIPYQEISGKGTVIKERNKAVLPDSQKSVSKTAALPAANNPFPEDDDELPF